MEEANNTISLKRLFINSIRYCVRKWHELSLFTIVHVVLLIIGFKFINGWHDKLFLLWIIPYYAFWCYFFRFYFDRKPYLMTKKIFDTLLPSTRILVLSLVIIILLAFVPLAIPFVSGNSPWVDSYIDHLQKYIDDTQTMSVVIAVIMMIISPFIFYRPMMAWIGSLIGRSGLLSTAFARTKGNYWQFLLQSIIFNAIFCLVKFLDKAFLMSGWLFIFGVSVVTVFFNIVLAKMYEYFFLEIDK